jgi:hypothetical protein
MEFPSGGRSETEITMHPSRIKKIQVAVWFKEQ